MFKLENIEIDDSNVLTSNNFARNSDVVYAEFLPDSDFEILKNEKDIKSITKFNGITLYKSNSFTLKENDLIFCHTLFIDSLFKHLNKINEFSNLKLITSQTDIPINKKMFQKKPNCVSKWYSINVDYSHKDLIQIPLGIAKSRNTKNLILEDFQDVTTNQKKENLLFSNFNLNTNYFHRYGLTRRVIDQEWSKVSKPNLTYTEYMKELRGNKYCLAPWGNGFDTHRIWEALYAGSIPVTINHIAFQNFHGLPIILLDSYDQLIIDNLAEFKFNELKYEMLTIGWWLDLINSGESLSVNKEIRIIENEDESYENIKLYYENLKILNKRKKINTLLRKVHKRALGKRINSYVSI